MNRPSVALLTVLAALSSLGGCATPSAYSDIAVEQERCAGYWRRSGDPDRASEMNRRANESRRVAASVDSWDNFFADILVIVLGGNRPPEPVKQAPHPSDPRGCEQ